MDEWEALTRLTERLPTAGDDAAVINETVITIDMLHDTTDFPTGMAPYTIGWRTAAVSLSDLAAMGAAPQAVVAAYGAPAFEAEPLNAFVDGAATVCEAVDATYAGGDLDHHDEMTTASAAVGTATEPVYRTGAGPGDVVCVTGTLGRSAAALTLFRAGETERANELFRFQPRITAGRQLADTATALIDSSDGLARSVHQLTAASGCGMTIERDRLPLADALVETTSDPDARLEHGLFFGEDFELVCTMPQAAYEAYAGTTPLTRIGQVTEDEVTLDDTPLPNRGYDHGSS